MNIKTITILSLVGTFLYGCDSQTADKVKNKVENSLNASPSVMNNVVNDITSAAQEAATFVKKGGSVILEKAKESVSTSLSEKSSEIKEGLKSNINIDKLKSQLNGGTSSVDGVVDSFETSVKSNIATVAPVISANTPGVTSAVELEQAESAQAASTEAETTAIELAAGKKIFTAKCFACHGTGAAGAPTLTDASWNERKQQGINILMDHALKGFKGMKGYMPAKGGDATLLDEEVSASVQYMVSVAN